MSNSRKNFQLKDIVNIQSSTRIFEKEYVEEGIPFYRSKEIIEKQKGNDVSTNLYISQERFNKIKQAYSVPRQGDILLTSVGTIGIPYMVRENEQFYFKDGNLTWFNNFSKEIDNKYFYYWILSEVGKEALNSILIGTTQKALTIKDLKSLEISLPPLSEQKRISSILSSFDNKIEQLKKQNNILEDIAQSIFKEWFVKYNFPNKDGKPYKDNNGKMIDSELGLIPEGWRVGKLGEIVELIMGESPKGSSYNETGEGMPLLNGAQELTKDTIIKTKYTTKPTKLAEKNDILFCIRATIGNIHFSDTQYCLGRGVAALRPQEDYEFFIYALLTNNLKYIALQAEGSVIKGLTKKIISGYKFPFNANISKRYNHISEPILHKYLHNSERISDYIKTRDNLIRNLI